VWKVFEHLRGRQALFGTPLPASPKAFATHMLVWAQAQAAANSETNSGFPTRVPGNLTTRLVAVFFLFAFFFFSAGGKHICHFVRCLLTSGAIRCFLVGLMAKRCGTLCSRQGFALRPRRKCRRRWSRQGLQARWRNRQWMLRGP
jgi:hypothetical protein